MIRVSSRNRLVGVGIVLISVIAVACGYVIRMERNEAIAAARADTINMARGTAAQTSDLLKSVDLVLRQVQPELALRSEASPVQVKLALRRKAMFDILVDRKKFLPMVRALSLIDADGVIANSSRAWPSSVADFPDLDMVAHLRQVNDAQMAVSRPIRNTAAQGWRIWLSRRLNTQRGAFAGIVAAEISLTDLEALYGTAMPANGSITIARRDGIILLHYPDREWEIGRKIPAGADWYAAVAAGGGAYETVAYFDPTEVLAAVRPLDGAAIVAETSVALGDALAVWQRQRLSLITGALYGAICVLMLLRMLDEQLRRLEASESTLADSNKNMQIANVHLETARRHLDVVFSNVSQGLCLFGASHRLIVCNKRYREIYHLPPGVGEPGVSLEEIINHCCAARAIFPAARTELLSFFTVTARSGKSNQSLLEMTDGRTIAIRQQPMPDGGWVATHEDITERRQAEARIAHLARHDVLTGLPNRSFFEERIEHAMAAAARGAEFAVLFLDLDRFKAVNDTLGHQAGDKLLRMVAARLLASVREIDTVARLGGDEFVILQVGLEAPDDAAQLAQRIIDVVGEPYEIGTDKVEIGVSIGVEISSESPSSADTLIKNADLALYMAKSEGRGIFRFFEPEMDAKAQNRYALERDLRQALANQEFEMYYQPIIDLRSRRICAFEGLLRWNHPVRGLVQPGEFIAAAEDCGLIVPIGAWVLRQVCQQAAGWPPAIHIAVNLSPIQFRASALEAAVTDALAMSGLAASRLELEITESVLLANDAATLRLLHSLRNLGICIAMDDFGIGYSSLSYLRRFPFDKIKIDQSFVADLTKRNEALFIVRAITGLCRNMGIRTTVEGVETAEQLAILVEEGCSEAQGFYFGAPQPAHLLAQGKIMELEER